jgi:hypothetical protein
MTQRFYKFKALAAVLATLIVNGPASASKEDTPFKGTSSGIVSTVGFDAEQNIVYTRLEGQGESTYLGHFSVTADVRIYVATPTGIAVGNWTYTAANGDKLFAILAGHAGADSFHGEAR